jgi:OOP family OmpA-OmpF porin
MTVSRHVRCLIYVAVSALGLPAAAQTQGSAGGTQANTARSSWLPVAGRSYVGLNLGRSRYNVPCTSISLLCDDSDRSVQLYAGGLVGNFWGVELGLLDMGRIARSGGHTRAQGLNLSLVGKAPLGYAVGVFGKLGTTYGRTDNPVLANGRVVVETDHGFGLSYGAGVSFDFTPRLSASLEWDSNDFRFAGSGRDAVRSTSLGLQYRY